MDAGVVQDMRVDSTLRPPIKVRRLPFRIPEDAPKYFWRNEKGVTAFAYALSAVFPDGERMFIDAVRHYRDRITDPALRRAITEFAGQEAQHGRVHEQYNEYAERKGFAVGDITRAVRRRIELMKTSVPAVARLGATAALEHFTALMAEQVLAHELFGEDVHEAHTELWRWHAAEEAEHKAVAFEVLQTVSGSYAVRMRSYAITSVMFPLLTMVHTFHIMKKDGTLTDVRAHLGLLKFLFIEPGLVPKVFPGWLDYLRPSFHPWDRDDRALLEKWQREWAPSTG
jgi:uncharacterized protein